MARMKMAQLLPVPVPDNTQTEAAEPALVPASAPAPAEPSAVRFVDTEKTPEPAPETAENRDAGGVPHYLTFVRKEARLRDDQIDALAAKARQINRHKKDGVERITDNTLIRIAVDLLLARADQLSGSTEDDLRNSVSS